MKKNMFKGNGYSDAVNKIKKMYESMLMLTDNDLDYANKLAKEICRLQMEDGSWKVFNAERIESDCMIGYGYIPTYYATAALVHLMNIDDKFKFEKELKKGFEFVTYNGRSDRFVGHGFDRERDQLEALNIYKSAGLYQWLLKHGERYEDINKLIKATINEYREALSTGLTYGGFAEDFREKYEKEVEEYEATCSEDVWYVAYGSNINVERFSEYISLCTNNKMPEEKIKYIIPHNIYFAYSSSRWQRKGVAFLDDTKPGKAYGCAYKIKMEQFYEIMKLEGFIYNKQVRLGFIEGVPAYTFTSEGRRSDIKEPSVEYIEIILRGLMQTYDSMMPLALEMYLYDRCVLDEIDKNVLGYIRNSAHGVSLEQAAVGAVSGKIVKTRKSIAKLAYYGFIKQDGANARLGHTLESREAVVYTRKEKRDLIDLITL